MSALARLYSVQKLSPGKLSIMPRPRGGDWLADEVNYHEAKDLVASSGA